jgi:hypothetical protein
MFRTVALLSILASLAACASAPMSETASLAHSINQDRAAAQNCPVAKYCVTTGTRIHTQSMKCGCNPPPALIGVKLRR